MHVGSKVFRRSVWILLIGGILGLVVTALIMSNEPRGYQSETVVELHLGKFSKLPEKAASPVGEGELISHETFRILENSLNEDSKWDGFSLYLIRKAAEQGEGLKIEKGKGEGAVKLTVTWSDPEMALELLESLPMACQLQLEERFVSRLAEKEFELRAWRKNREDELETSLSNLRKIATQVGLLKLEGDPLLWEPLDAEDAEIGEGVEGLDSEATLLRTEFGRAKNQYRKSREKLVALEKELTDLEKLSLESREFVIVRVPPKLATKPEKIEGLSLRLFLGFLTGLRWSILPVSLLILISHFKSRIAYEKAQPRIEPREQEGDCEDPW